MGFISPYNYKVFGLAILCFCKLKLLVFFEKSPLKKIPQILIYVNIFSRYWYLIINWGVVRRSFFSKKLPPQKPLKPLYM